MNSNDADDITLRPVTPADAADIARMVRRLAEATGELHKVRSTAEDFARHGFGDAPAFLGMLALCGDQPVGLSLWFYNFSSWRGDLGVYLQDIYVDEELRGRGIGKRLLAETVRRARADGATHLRLSVATDNDTAREFYARLGFTYRDDECIYQIADAAFGELAARG